MRAFKLAVGLISAGLAACSTATDVDRETGKTESITVSRLREQKVGELAYDAAAPSMGFAPPEPQITEQYEKTDPNPVKLVSEEPVSTFSSDVDTTAYSVMRRYISNNNRLPPSNSVRIEEYVNYFDYQYTAPTSADTPFAPTIWVTPSPWNTETRLMHIGVKGFDIDRTDRGSLGGPV